MTFATTGIRRMAATVPQLRTNVPKNTAIPFMLGARVLLNNTY